MSQLPISKSIGCRIGQLLADSIVQPKGAYIKDRLMSQINELLKTDGATADRFNRDDLKFILHFLCTA